jgi:hypothetical protein
MQQIEQSIDRYLAAMDSADRATPEVAEAKAERLKGERRKIARDFSGRTRPGQSGFDGAIPANTSRPAYHPAILLKNYIYGYLNRIQSNRRLEREAPVTSS